MLMRLFPSISVTLIKSGSGWNEELWWRWVVKRFAQLLVSAEPDVGGLWDHLICRWAELPELILKISISFLGLLAAHSNWLWSVKVRQPLTDHFSTLDFLCHGNICGSPERDSVELKNINPVDKLFCSGWESVQSSKHPDFNAGRRSTTSCFGASSIFILSVKQAAQQSDVSSTRKVSAVVYLLMCGYHLELDATESVLNRPISTH